MKKKKKGTFRYVMWTYAAVWILVTIVVCAVIWINLDKYQSSYNLAQEMANPELAMTEVMEQLQQSNIGNIVRNQNPEVLSRFETIEDYETFYEGFLEGKTLTYAKDEERYNDARPVYKVYADEALFAVVSLKAAGEKDSFGFNQWTVQDIVLSENNYVYYDAYLQVMGDMTIYINGMSVETTELVREEVMENPLSEKTYALTGKSFSTKVYYAGDFVQEPEILVLDGTGNDISAAYVVEENELHSYETYASEEFIESVSSMVKDFCETYIYHIYRKASVDSVAAGMEDGSEAEAILYNIQSTLAWAWVPDTVEILAESYGDYVYYNENYFSCESTFTIRKADESQEETEEFSYQWLFKKVNGEWMVTYFVLS